MGLIKIISDMLDNGSQSSSSPKPNVVYVLAKWDVSTGVTIDNQTIKEFRMLDKESQSQVIQYIGEVMAGNMFYSKPSYFFGMKFIETEFGSGVYKVGGHTDNANLP